MRITRTRLLVVAALSVAAAFAVFAGLGGCSPKAPVQVSSAWPAADKERVVKPPAAPQRWPYTGLDAVDGAELNRRPLSVKIENSPASRPQFNLSSADVVYESVTEGGITRFNAIYHSTLPDRIGPVRSARLSDLWVVPQYNALFAFSGASSSVNSAVRNAGLSNLSQDAGVSKPYSRSSQRKAPHNLILDPTVAYSEAANRSMTMTGQLKPLQFGRAEDSTGTATAAQVTIPFSKANTVNWDYDETNGNYLRANNGAAHMDGATGNQLTADNIVVMWAKHAATRGRDKTGSTTYDITLGGEGRVTILRDGKRYDGTWVAEADSPPRFKDADGKPIKLKPGRTWFQVIELNGALIMR
jgi:hypothetical protein